MAKFAAILLFAVSNLFSQWFAQPSGTVATLKSVRFINENTGFITGINSVLKTTNAGEQWNITNVPGSHNDIKFVNQNTGFLCSDNGKIFRSTDAGNSWNEILTGTNNNLMRIEFVNENTGLAVGFKRTILKTTDSGSNWVSLISNNDTVNLLGCKFLSESRYIVTGTSSIILLSANSGASWNFSTLGFVNPLWAPEFINENTGWITGCCGIFIKTTNAGLTWSPDIYLTLGNTVYTMEFINNTTGYLCGDAGVLYRTTNSGEWWDSTVTGTEQILYSLNMVNPNTGWCVGNFGTILKTTNGGGPGFPIGIKQVSSQVPENYMLHQNYPNPFNPKTNIKFDIKKQGNVKLTLFNILGGEMKVLINGFYNAGTYIYEMDFSEHASGVYFYKLSTDGYSNVKKLVLVR